MLVTVKAWEKKWASLGYKRLSGFERRKIWWILAGFGAPSLEDLTWPFEGAVHQGFGLVLQE